MKRVLLYAVVLLLACLHLPRVVESSARCKAWLVLSIPTDMPELPRISGVLSTGDVFQWLANNSTRSLDIIAQYWQLLASPKDPRSGDFGYSDSDLQQLGAHIGSLVYKSIDNAANRNVSIRLMSHSGVYPEYTKEPSDLASGRSNVKNVTLLLSKWWGSGIVHAKVKEVGIYLSGCSQIARNIKTYFDNLWRLASLDSSVHTRNVSDQQWLINRTVPCWSHFIPNTARCRSPLPNYIETPNVSQGYPSLSDPEMYRIDIESALSINHSCPEPQRSYLSFAPPELLFGKHQSDEQGWVDTIKSVVEGGTVRINTMDWLGQSQYTNPKVYWSSLSSAVSEVVFAKNAKVKILVAYWGHFIEATDGYLRSLLYSNVLCSSSSVQSKCFGQVEIRYYMVPGFNKTGPAVRNGTRTGNRYPDYTRVNHGKYVVSDVRAHIGTSNLVWDYFFATSGVSFGTYNTKIVLKLQDIFDADWNSPYVVPVQEFG
ncbi:unnamed protein product [Thlaspi arvense]|uniref:PLD phosphodiesterase domain-containing protein n=1 Tax=Thlaspi arvense TaxID=13288 RepID=A0AAU9RML7_THLAR|nr:unnamed protein product [Thlaspi arvense]